MSYIILTRNSRGKLVIITDGEDNIPSEFGDEDEASEAAKEVPICQAWGYMVVEVA